ncbi:MAG: hypothetical protein Q9190_006336, partial [Brigantiaea leucoxantha]
MDQTKIFAAVFGSSKETSIPTPVSTPVLGSGEFGSSQTESNVPEQVQWDRAWHTATTFLALPRRPLPHELDDESVEKLDGTWFKACNVEILKAIRYLVSRDSPGYCLRRHQRQDDLLQWYFEEVGQRHYLTYVRPTVLE